MRLTFVALRGAEMRLSQTVLYPPDGPFGSRGHSGLAGDLAVQMWYNKEVRLSLGKSYFTIIGEMETSDHATA